MKEWHRVNQSLSWLTFFGQSLAKIFNLKIPENSQDGSDMPRFTLSGERSVPSPAENRGRPRKIRVEKTQQIPVGSAKDIEGSRGAPDHVSRKQPTTCTYARTSVIHSMATPPEDMRAVPSVKEEYVSPDGKRKSPAVSQERMPYEKKVKQDFRKAEANRIFEAEREKLKTRHVESHYANEVRNMQLRCVSSFIFAFVEFHILYPR